MSTPSPTLSVHPTADLPSPLANVTARFLTRPAIPLPLLLAGLYLIDGLCLRGLLWAAFGVESGVPAPALPAVFALGLWRDLVVGGWLILPLAALLFVLPRQGRTESVRVNAELSEYLGKPLVVVVK